MNRSIQSRAAAIAAACLSLVAAAPALAANATATSSAVIVSPNVLVNVTSLDFGNIIPSSSAGTVTINAQSGARTTTGGVTAAGGTVSYAKFEGSGTPYRVVDISNANPTLTLTRVGGTETMTVDNFRLSVDGGAETTFTTAETIPNNAAGGSLDIGVVFFAVGGQLNVGAGQAEGDYTGTFTLSMDYQ